MVNAILGSSYDLTQRLNQIERNIRDLSTQPILRNASTGQVAGQPGVSTDMNGVHLFDATGIEVTTLRSSDGTILVTYPNGTLQLSNDPSGVPGIFFQWTKPGTVQTGGAEIFTSESGLTINGPTTSTNGTKFSYVNLLDVGAEIWTGGAGVARMLSLGSNWSWQVGDTGTGHPAVYGNPDGSWVLGRAGGNQIYANATGATQITGGLTVTGAKSFSMEHPLDPTKNLVHASTESPVNGVEYWGEVTLDQTGTADVALPSYFEALTKVAGRTVHLTASGGPCATVPWASKIANGKFTVNASAGACIHWLVKAERHQVVNGIDVLAFAPETPKPAVPETPTWASSPSKP